MNDTLKHRIIRLLAILLVQIVICNNIHAFGYAPPVLLAYLTMKFHRGSSRESLLVWGFIIGLIFDIFSNTMGKGMAVCTLMGMLQPYLLGLFSPTESVDMLVPSFKTMGFDRYIYYVVSTMLIFHFVFYFLEDFSFRHPKILMTGTFVSTLLAVLFVIVADVFSPKDRNVD
jgi:rod shape-determining protein MreD